MTNVELRNWRLSFTHPVTGERVAMDATVPGNVEIDLMREGLVGDPMPPDDRSAMRVWEGVAEWTYETTFDAPDVASGESVHLVFDGVDTVAEVFLNGESVLRCDNMFVPFDVEVGGRLRAAGNGLRVVIRGALAAARDYDYGHRQLPARSDSAAYLRKARHMWGWDNAPRLLSAGLWRPVRVEGRPPFDIEACYLFTSRVTESEVAVGMDYRLRAPGGAFAGGRGTWELWSGGERAHVFDFDVDFVSGRVVRTLARGAVRLWEPRGFGEPHLYESVVRIESVSGRAAEWRERFGIRDIELLRTEETTRDGAGEFVFVCNGRRIFARGTNWKPLDALHSRAFDRTRAALDLCLDLNCNMLRVWGGGIYESDAFYDICDEIGLLVWQDFPFACEIAPDDPGFLARVGDEARTVVARLRNHACLAAWCGDNEVDVSHSWGPERSRHLLPSDNRITRDVLRRAVRDHDPFRSYVPSSPYVSDRISAARWLGERPPMHLPEDHLYPTDERFREVYRETPAHFVGETGPFFINAASQSPDIVARELPRARRLWDVPIGRDRYTLAYHQDDDYFLTWKDAARRRLRAHFGRDFPLEPWDDLALGVNIICGEMFKFVIEWFRSRKWRRTGVLWWSLLDMWPMAFNYSVVDHALRPKQPCYDWIRDSQRDVCLMVTDPGGGDLELWAANDTARTAAGSQRITAVDADGAASVVSEGRWRAPANESVLLAHLPRSECQAIWMIRWDNGADSSQGGNHFITGGPPYDFATYRRWLAIGKGSNV